MMGGMDWTSYLAGLATLPAVAIVGWWALGIIDRAGWSRRYFTWNPGVHVRPLMVSITPSTVMLVGRPGWAVWLERRRRGPHLFSRRRQWGWPRPCQPRDGWPMRWAILGPLHLQKPLPPGVRIVRRP